MARLPVLVVSIDPDYVVKSKRQTLPPLPTIEGYVFTAKTAPSKHGSPHFTACAFNSLYLTDTSNPHDKQQSTK